ncbi:unnamed protein product [Pylaiella littoralis]
MMEVIRATNDHPGHPSGGRHYGTTAVYNNSSWSPSRRGGNLIMTNGTTTSRRFSSVAALLRLLLIISSSSWTASTVTAAELQQQQSAGGGGVEQLPLLLHHTPSYHAARKAGGGVAAFLRSSDSSDTRGQVDVILDLVCTESAKAWPTLKRIVRDQRDRVDFVLHILPLSDGYPVGYFAAKAVQVILANADGGGTYDDVETFVDQVFRGQVVILDDEGTDSSFDATKVVSEWAMSTSGMTEELFFSAMQDPAFDEAVLGDLEKYLTLSMPDAPAVVLNDVFAMELGENKNLRYFEIFISSRGEGDVGFSSTSDLTEYHYDFFYDDDQEDDLSGLLPPVSGEMGRETGTGEFENAKRLQQQQQLLHEKKAEEQHNSLFPAGAQEEEEEEAAAAAAAAGAVAAVEQLLQRLAEGLPPYSPGLVLTK